MFEDEIITLFLKKTFERRVQYCKLFKNLIGEIKNNFEWLSEQATLLSKKTKLSKFMVILF